MSNERSLLKVVGTAERCKLVSTEQTGRYRTDAILHDATVKTRAVTATRCSSDDAMYCRMDITLDNVNVPQQWHVYVYILSSAHSVGRRRGTPVCVRACVRACVHACLRAFASIVRVHVLGWGLQKRVFFLRNEETKREIVRPKHLK